MNFKDAVISVDFIAAKLRGMRGKMIEGDNLRDLTDVRYLPDLLKRLGIAGTDQGVSSLERSLTERTITDLLRVRRYLNGASLDVFQALLIRYHVEDLKVVVRAYAARADLSTIENLLLPLPKDLTLPIHLLQESADPRRFLKHLPVLALAKAIREGMQHPEDMDLFKLQMDLDSAYWKLLLDAASRAGTRSQMLIQRDVAAQNLLMVLRAKTNWGLPFEEVEKRFVPDRLYLSLRSAREIHSAPDLLHAIMRIPPRLLMQERVRTAGSIVAVEDALAMEQFRLAARMFVKSVLDLGVVVAWFYLKRAELMNVTRLCEGVRHGMPREEIEPELMFRSNGSK